MEINLRKVRELVDTDFDQVRTKVLAHEAKIAEMDQHVQGIPALRGTMDVHEHKIKVLDQYAVGHESRVAQLEVSSTQMNTDGRTLAAITQTLEE